MSMDSGKKTQLAFEFRAELGHRRQVELVAAGKDALFLVGAEGVFDHSIVFIGAEDQAERGLVTRGKPLAVEIIDIELELAKVLMGEFANLQIKQHITLEHGMVKDQIDVEMVAVEGEALLAGDKGKALAQFEQEGLQLAEEGGFQLRLDQLGGRAGFSEIQAPADL